MREAEERESAGGRSSTTATIGKVPRVTLGFWAIKICATTVGETGGDAVSMTFGLGYAVSSLIFLGVFAVALAGQVVARRLHPSVYWSVVVATTTVGTTMSDYLDRTAGLGYPKSSVLLFTGVVVVLLVWRRVTGTIQFEEITSRPNEVFYWLTILVSNTLGTALGDFVAETTDLGFGGAALVFAALLAIVCVAYWLTDVPRAALFWSAYILTRPLGATLGDSLTKPRAEGGLELSRVAASLSIATIMVVAIALTSRRAARLAAGSVPTGEGFRSSDAGTRR